MTSKLFLAILSAILLRLSFPAFTTYYLAWFALVPLFLAIKTSSSMLQSFVVALTMFFAFHSLFLWWGSKVGGVNYFNYTLSHLALAGYYGVFGLGANYFEKYCPRWNLLTYPLLWVLVEYLRSHAGFLSWPMGIIGYTQFSVLPLAQLASLTGVYGVSFLIVAVNALIAEAIFRISVRSSSQAKQGKGRLGAVSSPLLLSGALLFLTFSWLFFRSDNAGSAQPRDLRVSLVQGNVQYKEISFAEDQKESLRVYRNLTQNLYDDKPDLIIWPSSAVTGMIPYDRFLLRGLAGLARRGPCYLLFGTTGYNKLGQDNNVQQKVANSAFLMSPRGRITGRYDKIRLLPFDEYVPLRNIIHWPSFISSDDIQDSKPGENKTLFTVAGLKFRVLICWENLFADQFREMATDEVDFMVSMTNEKFTSSPAAHYQMLAMNVFRAIENHVPVIRISSTGVSCIIDHRGKMLARVRDSEGNDINIAGVLTENLVHLRERSFYSRHGDLIVGLLLIVLIGISFDAIYKQRRRRRTTRC